MAEKNRIVAGIPDIEWDKLKKLAKENDMFIGKFILKMKSQLTEIPKLIDERDVLEAEVRVLDRLVKSNDKWIEKEIKDIRCYIHSLSVDISGIKNSVSDLDYSIRDIQEGSDG